MIDKIDFFRKTGELKYVTHENFGYQNVVDSLVEGGMSETICSSLNPLLAESGDEYEILKVNLVMY